MSKRVNRGRESEKRVRKGVGGERETQRQSAVVITQNKAILLETNFIRFLGE